MARANRRERILTLLRSRAITVSLIIVAAVVCVALGREVGRRVAVQREIDQLTEDITAAEQETEELNQLLATLKSSTYEEGAARTYFNLKKEGENVLVIPDLTTDADSDAAALNDNASSSGSASGGGSGAPDSNSKKWWEYLFHTSPT